jgi:hypothetical protein
VPLQQLERRVDLPGQTDLPNQVVNDANATARDRFGALGHLVGGARAIELWLPLHSWLGASHELCESPCDLLLLTLELTTYLSFHLKGSPGVAGLGFATPETPGVLLKFPEIYFCRA